jgi:two-component system chemotaxis response regulator CheY
VYGAILTQGGHEVVGVAFNGVEAIEKISQLKPLPSIIIMDHRMPVMDGLTATKELKQKLPRCQVVFISADETVKQASLKAGAKLFIVKPVGIATLLDAVQSLA